jgi:hypothetical protein
MTWLVASILYLALHGGLYFAVLRRTAWCTRERGVFLYHALSALGFTVAAGAAWLWLPALEVDFALAVGTVLLHGIYSTSFLESWSLAQGGYSLQILRSVAAAEAAGRPVDLVGLEQIGAGKQAVRLSGLAGLGLIARRGGAIGLTRRGRTVAGLLGALHALAAGRGRA